MTALAAALAAEGQVSAGPVGLVLVLLIGVCTVLLIRNMDRRVKRLPREFPPPPASPPPPGPRQRSAEPD